MSRKSSTKTILTPESSEADAPAETPVEKRVLPVALSQDEKLQGILKAIVRLAAGDFRAELPTSVSDDPLDWIASGINNLAEELKATVISRDHFNLIVSSMPDSLIVLDRLGYIEFANLTTVKLLRTEAELLQGLHFSRICPKLYENRASGESGFDGHGLDAPIELEYRGPNGVILPVLFSASAMSQASSRGRGWICAAQDLRSRKILENSLREKDRILAQSSKMAALGEMAAGIAHEINNPMAIIAGRAEQLRDLANEGAIEPAAALKISESVHSTIKRVVKIVGGLRTFSREGEGDPFVNVSVKQIIEDTVALCADRFRVHHVDLRIEAFDAKLDVDCREVQIVQVLVNLLNNAFDAVQDLKERWVQLSADSVVTLAGEVIEFSVLDSGPGIPEEVRSKIMQPFFSTKAAGKGTGLGLSIASSILLTHTGTLTLDDQIRQTRFVIRLPRRRRSQPLAA